jgi:hypothetical protein
VPERGAGARVNAVPERAAAGAAAILGRVTTTPARARRTVPEPCGVRA